MFQQNTVKRKQKVMQLYEYYNLVEKYKNQPLQYDETDGVTFIKIIQKIIN